MDSDAIPPAILTNARRDGTRTAEEKTIIDPGVAACLNTAWSPYEKRQSSKDFVIETKAIARLQAL